MASDADQDSEPEVSGSAEEPLPTPIEELAAQKREERLRKFRELHLKRNEARKLNYQELVEEDKRLKLPSNWEAKKARLEWELKEEERKKECAAKGEDYVRVKLLEISAEDADKWERKKKRKNPDLGFSAGKNFIQHQTVFCMGLMCHLKKELTEWLQILTNKLKNEKNIAEDVLIMMMRTLTTLMREMPSLIRKQRGSMANTLQRSSRT
ncbi:pre-mRNA-splicing factor SYF2 isoform X2 [Microcaecilia unicolor]|uniref:Pre-mRNA-splicing factor SYF2 n=1 Tax=Microcaecilia unicolor TaxID=1415580 RepID=A0A6P7XXE6_9AMPH|nr:pre-mRNA-splicing factor SYF2 isoform X2 [Microcaecilia unicolor]